MRGGGDGRRGGEGVRGGGDGRRGDEGVRGRRRWEERR